MYECYSFKKKKSLGLIITILVCLLIAGATAILVYKALFTPLPKNEGSLVEGEPVSSIPLSNTIKYQKNTRYTLYEEFLCGHKKESELPLPHSFIGKNIDQIREENPHLEIISYNDFSINALLIRDEICDGHYIIRLSGNQLIACKKNNTDEILKRSDFNRMEFSKDDIKILESGIEVGSKEEMLEFFEDFAI